MIKIKFIHDKKECEIIASGLGDLGWQLDCWGCDTKSEDEYFKIISIEYLPNKELPEGMSDEE